MRLCEGLNELAELMAQVGAATEQTPGVCPVPPGVAPVIRNGKHHDDQIAPRDLSPRAALSDPIRAPLSELARRSG